MTSPISALARRWVRARATDVMEYICRIERGAVADDDYDPDTLIYPALAAGTLVYEGPCRIWEVASTSSVVVGDTDIYQQSTQLSLPWDTPEVVRRYDQVTIMVSPQDPQMVGKRYEVQSVAKAGELRATRRFEIIGVN